MFTAHARPTAATVATASSVRGGITLLVVSLVSLTECLCTICEAGGVLGFEGSFSSFGAPSSLPIKRPWRTSLASSECPISLYAKVASIPATSRRASLPQG